MASKKQRPLNKWGVGMHSANLSPANFRHSFFDVRAVTATRNLRGPGAPELLEEVGDGGGYLVARLIYTVGPKENLQCLRLAEPL